MTEPDKERASRFLPWKEASRRTRLQWPVAVAFGGVVVTGYRLLFGVGSSYIRVASVEVPMLTLFTMFACALIALAPLWYYLADRIQWRLAVPSLGRRVSLGLGVFLAALVLSPTIGVTHVRYGGGQDASTAWVKRSLLSSIREPRIAHDELAWLQSNFSSEYIPADVFCPRRSIRGYPLFGVERSWDVANALARARPRDGDRRPPAELLAASLARCRSEGAAMLEAGLTKEAALRRGDIDGFFARAVHDGKAGGAVVLEDEDLPPSVLASVEAFLATQADTYEYLASQASPHWPGQVRRLRPLAIAAALGREGDVARLRGGDR